MAAFRVIIALFCAVAMFSVLSRGGFTGEAFWGVIPFFAVSVLAQVFLQSFLEWTLKLHIKAMKKNGKVPYSSSAELEFFENHFVETTQDHRSEVKYEAVERISILEDKVIYIHVNNVMAYTLPMSCFATRDRKDEFVEFLKTKCEKVDVYEK